MFSMGVFNPCTVDDMHQGKYKCITRMVNSTLYNFPKIDFPQISLKTVTNLSVV